MRLIAESFTWPFRGGRRSSWLIGLLAVVFLPIAFVPLLGYAVAATRAATAEMSQGPPPWHWSQRLWWDGAWTASAILVITAPFVLAYNPIVNAFLGSGSSNLLVTQVLVALALALPWGCVLLLVMPHATARFALTAHWNDLFDYVGVVRRVREDFARWNLVAAAIVTAWVIGLACAALLCVGVVPGIFYAILVSAHASAALNRESPSSSAR